MSQSKFWNDFDLADHLGVRPSMIATLGRAGKIPCIKIGKYRRYDPESEEFKAWLDSLRVKRENAAQSERGEPTQEDQDMARKSYQKGSIEQREGKQGVKWVLRYRIRSADQWIGKTEELQIPGSSSQKDARAAADKRMIEVNQINSGTKADVTFKSFAEGLWRSYLNRVKESTAASYASILNNDMLPHLASKRLREITPADITSLLAIAEQKRATGKSLMNVYGLLRVMFEVALEYDLIESSPVRRKLHRPKLTLKQKVAFTPEQIKRVIESAEGEHRTILVCVALTGLRAGELLALRWSNVDFESSRLTVTHSLWSGRLYAPKSEASKRALHLPEVLATVLKAHYHQARWTGPDDFVFSGRDGQPHSHSYLLQRVLYPALGGAGIKREPGIHGIHLFRHSAATILDAETRSLRAGRDLLGHANESMTASYTHSPRETVEATEILARKIMGNCALAVTESSEVIQ